MIQAKLTNVEQVFLPYAQDASGRTFYELMREQKFQPVLLESTNQRTR